MGASSSRPPLGKELQFTTLTVLPDLKRTVLRVSSKDPALKAIASPIVRRSWRGVVKSERKISKYTFEYSLSREYCNKPTDEDPIQLLLLDFSRMLTRLGWRLILNANITTVYKTIVILFQYTGGNLPQLTSVSFRNVRSSNKSETPHQEFTSSISKEISIMARRTLTAEVTCTKAKDPIYKIRGMSRCRQSRPEDVKLAALALMRVFSDQGWRLVMGLNERHSLPTRHPSTLWFEESRQLTSRLFLLGLTGRNGLYAIDAPLVCVTIIRSLIQKLWPEGLVEEDKGLTLYGFTLQGQPWFQSQKQAIRSRFLIVCILEELRFIGWRVRGALNPTGGGNDVACFCMESVPPQNCTYMSITLVNDDTLWLINTPLSVIEHLRKEFGTVFKSLRRDDLFKGCHRFSFEASFETIPGILCVLLESMDSIGWSFVTAASTSKHCINHLDPKTRVWTNAADSLFFEKVISLEDSYYQ